LLNVDLEEAEAAAAVIPSVATAPGSAVMARRVLWLAWPVVLEQTLNMTVGLVDTYMVGHLGAAQLAAVGLSIQVVMLMSVLFAAVAVGSTALVARHIGADQPDIANRVVQQSLLIALLIGIFCTVLGLVFAPTFMVLFGAAPDVVGYGAVYLRIVSTTVVLTVILFSGNAALRGAGDTRSPLLIMLFVNVVNIFVAYSFIYGALGMPKLGVTGSALGAAVARGLGGVAVLYVLWYGHPLLRLKGRKWAWDGVQMRRILNIGLPSGLEQFLLYAAQVGFAVVIARLGTAAFAAYEVSINVTSMSFMPGFGFSLAATTLVGQYLGARDRQSAERSGYTAFFLALATMLAICLLLLVFARPITAAFISDPEVIDLGSSSVRVAALTQPPLAAAMVFAGALRGAGDTRGVLLAMGSCIWVLRLPLGILLTLPLGWGLNGAWAAMGVDFTVRGVWLWLRYRRGRWKDIEV
jgi:putative MATE family efflux protein